jgi:hypothetical protein
MSEVLSLETALTGYDMRLGQLGEYTKAVLPQIVAKPALLRVFIDGTIVLSVAHFEDFMRGLVGAGTRYREAALRKHFTTHGNDSEKAQAPDCDIFELVRMAKRRVSFKERFARTEKIFNLMFGCSAWPSESARDVIFDLVLVRNMIVHQGSADLRIGGDGTAQYAEQLHRTDVFKVTSYGEFTIYRIEPLKALVFYGDAATALQAQIEHLREHLVRSDGWLRLP